jgi:hypothetical protein
MRRQRKSSSCGRPTGRRRRTSERASQFTTSRQLVRLICCVAGIARVHDDGSTTRSYYACVCGELRSRLSSGGAAASACAFACPGLGVCLHTPGWMARAERLMGAIAQRSDESHHRVLALLLSLYLSAAAPSPSTSPHSCLCVYLCVYLCSCVRVSIQLYTHTRARAHTHTHTHTHTCVYIYTHACVSRSNSTPLHVNHHAEVKMCLVFVLVFRCGEPCARFSGERCLGSAQTLLRSIFCFPLSVCLSVSPSLFSLPPVFPSHPPHSLLLSFRHQPPLCLYVSVVLSLRRLAPRRFCTAYRAAYPPTRNCPRALLSVLPLSCLVAWLLVLSLYRTRAADAARYV